MAVLPMAATSIWKEEGTRDRKTEKSVKDPAYSSVSTEMVQY